MTNRNFTIWQTRPAAAIIAPANGTFMPVGCNQQNIKRDHNMAALIGGGHS